MVKTPVTTCRPSMDFREVWQPRVLPVRTGATHPWVYRKSFHRLCRLQKVLLHTSSTDIPCERGAKSPPAQILRLYAQIKNQNVTEASPGSLYNSPLTFLKANKTKNSWPSPPTAEGIQSYRIIEPYSLKLRQDFQGDTLPLFQKMVQISSSTKILIWEPVRLEATLGLLSPWENWAE